MTLPVKLGWPKISVSATARKLKNPISDSQIKTIFYSKIQSFDARRLIFWILGINEPIIHCVKNNWSQGTPSLKT